VSETTCQLCVDRVTRVCGEHVRVSLERGVEQIGACTAPDAGTPREPEKPIHPRLAAWAERMCALGKPVKGPPPLLATARAGIEREPGEDDGEQDPVRVVEGGAPCR
jgi:hypothetical protein